MSNETSIFSLKLYFKDFNCQLLLLTIKLIKLLRQIFYNMIKQQKYIYYTIVENRDIKYFHVFSLIYI